MLDDNLEKQLQKDLEHPVLAAPHPSQARYRINPPVARRLAGGWPGVGGALVAAAVVMVVLLSAGTGSTNPRIWTLRVGAALTQLTEPAAAPTPVITPEATLPAGESSGGGASPRGSQATGPAISDRDSSPEPGAGERGNGGSPRPGSEDPTPAPSPEPSGTPDEHGGGRPSAEPRPSPSATEKPQN